MTVKTGIFLQSTEDLDETFFARAIIYLTEYNAAGAVGFVINKPCGRLLSDLVEFRHSARFPLFDGGPVDKEHLFFLHGQPDVVEGGKLVSNGIYSGGNFGQAVKGINNKTLSPDDLKIFVGYCGWDAGELESEIREGSWRIGDGENNDIFNPVAL